MDTKILTWVIYALIFVLTSATAYQQFDLSRVKDELPKEYVRLERYKCDQETIKNMLMRIEKSVDSIRDNLKESSRELNHKIDNLQSSMDTIDMDGYYTLEGTPKFKKGKPL
jgi:septal ring factor EnvC (AmiA/AmiB activator)